MTFPTLGARAVSGALAGTTSRPHAVPLPRDFRWLRPRDIWFAIGLIGAVLSAMWVRHGGLARDPLTGLGELAALAGTYASLLGVLFISRAPWIDQVLGADRLRSVHRVLGFAAVWGIGAHAVLSTIAFAGGSLAAVPGTLVSLVETVPGMLGALVSFALFFFVGVTSVRAIRRRLSYETWHGLHLYAYLAVAFGFLHQLTIGTDFTSDRLATAFWIALYVIAFGLLLVHRVAWPILVTLRHRPRVAAIVPEAEGIFSLYVEGRDLDRLAVRSGQFFIVRALTRADWNHGHPFSISAAPNGRYIRFTIKEFGQGTRALRRLRPGTPLMLEGPYGAMTGARRTGGKLLLVAGGIGISPLRAMAENFAFEPGGMALVYRTPDRDDVPLGRELEALAARRGIDLHVVAGRRGERGVARDPLGPEAIRRLVPDAADRDVYLCGPNALMERARAALVSLGAEPARINLELFT